MEILFYIASLGISIYIATWILKKYSIFSCPGLLVLFLISYLLSDVIGLLIISIGNINYLPLPLKEEMALRAYPTFLYAIGLVCFLIGLIIVYSKPLHRININQNNKEYFKYFKILGLFFVVIPLFMTLASYATEGIYSWSALKGGMYKYSYMIKRFEFLKFGHILTYIGFALLAVSARSRFWQLAALISSGLFGLLLTESKAGIMFAAIAFFVVLYIYDYYSFRQWFRPIVLFVLLIAVLVGLNIKNQIKYSRSVEQEFNLGVRQISELSFNIIKKRWGPIGTYRGYSVLVERLRENPWWHAGGKVLYFSSVSSFPRFLWHSKPIIPTKGIGYLVDPYSRNDPNSAYATTLPGSWFFDLGFVGLIFGMFFSGFFIGTISRFFSKSKMAIKYAPAYMFFIISSISFAEAGIINFFSRLTIIIIIVLFIAVCFEIKKIA